MDFISEYYLWFVIGGIILVMAVIGYIADKTDFGRKDMKTGEIKKEPKQKDNTEEVTKNINVPSEVNNVDIKVEEPMIEKTEEIIEEQENIEIDDINSFAMPSIDEVALPTTQVETSEEVTTGSENTNQEEVVLEPIETEVEIEPVKEDEIEIKEVTDDYMFTLNNDLSSFAAAEFVNPIGSADAVDNTVSEVIGEDIPAKPAPQTIEEVVNDYTIAEETDEDIWKF